MPPHGAAAGGVPVGAPPVGAAVVDVRDVAAAHCAALARPHARGRYLLASRPVYPLPLAAKVCWGGVCKGREGLTALGFAVPSTNT